VKTYKYAPGPDGVAVLVSEAEFFSNLDEARAEQKGAVRDAAWAYVEQHLDQREREALSALLQKVTLMRGMGMEPDEGATLALLATLQWAEDVLASYAPLSAAIDDAETFADIMAVTFDPSPFAPPPTVSATEIALALRGGA
jgi:hypothetical protein